jgi:Cu/Ag efflux pump CusA
MFGMVYMFSRLALNMAATFTPLYLTTVVGFVEEEGTSVAVSLVPFASYFFSFMVSTFLMDSIIRKFRNRFKPMLIATIVSLIGFLPLLFLEPDNWTRWLVYPLACF